ncbi:MAG: hypothetical protein ACRC0S_08040 [Fusobacteriaceae bacterium]
MNLNRIKNYVKLAEKFTPAEQFLKIQEEISELKEELLSNFDRKLAIGEALDIITATYNLLNLLEANEDDMQLHVEKLNDYLNNKCKGM